MNSDFGICKCLNRLPVNSVGKTIILLLLRILLLVLNRAQPPSTRHCFIIIMFSYNRDMFYENLFEGNKNYGN